MEQNKKYGYIAGPLFNEGEIHQRLKEAKILREKMPNVEWYNPIEAPVNDKEKLPTAVDIFTLDTEHVLKSDYVLADLSREDLGVSMELGICLGTEFSNIAVEKIFNTKIAMIEELLVKSKGLDNVEDVHKHCKEHEHNHGGKCDCIKKVLNISEEEIENAKKILEILKKEVMKDIEELGVKKRKVVAHNSDIRIESSGKYDGIYVPYGYNQYVIGGLNKFKIPIELKSEQAIEKLSKDNN